MRIDSLSHKVHTKDGHMEKFQSQQAALRQAFTTILGSVPRKGELVITEEQRLKVGELMMEWFKVGLWSIRPGTKASGNPFNYIVGKEPTCLIEAWIQPRKKEQSQAILHATQVAESKFDIIKKALDAGLLTKEEAQRKVAELLG